MSTSGSFAPTQDTIDLTLDDDSSTPPPTNRATSTSVEGDDEPIATRTRTAAPPFGQPQSMQVIDLSSDEYAEDEQIQLDRPFILPQLHHAPLSSSPEVQFVRERVLPPVPDPRPPHDPQQARLHTPMATGFRGAMARIWQGGAPFGYFNPGGEDQGFAFGHLNNYLRGHNYHHHPHPPPHHPAPARDPFQAGHPIPATNFDGVELDYTGAGFNIGGDLIVEAQPPAPAGDRDYKAPAAPQEGFKRTFDEDDVLVCALCGDELATGLDEVKQQVWAIKQCGHVYCGTCAASRGASKDPKTKQSKNSSKIHRSPIFKICQIPDCGKPVSAKTAMFQIYL